MKATERYLYFLVVLFIVIYKVALTYGGRGGSGAGTRETQQVELKRVQRVVAAIWRNQKNDTILCNRKREKSWKKTKTKKQNKKEKMELEPG